MSGSLVPLRVVLILAAILVGIAFVGGHLYYDSNQPGCLYGKHWQTDQWTVLFSVYDVELRAHPYGCPKSDQYDKKTTTGGSTIAPGVYPAAN